VLTEAAWLLRFDPASVEKLLESTALGVYRILELTEMDATAIAAILTKYRRLKPQLADAALVHLARRESIETVFTIAVTFAFTGRPRIASSESSQRSSC
jgi:predicted nucleic acid-binding protein